MNATGQNQLGLPDRFPLAVAVAAVALGVLVLLGWKFGLEALKSVLPGLTSMKANTALGFILSGVSLWGTQTSRQGMPLQIAAQVCAGVVVVLGMLTLGEYLSGVNFGIDQLLIQEITDLPGDIPGRMAVNTAFSFAALGAALLLLSQGKCGMVVAIHALAMVVIIVAGSALIGYAYDIEEFLRVKLNYTPMAVNTAAVFVLLALGVVDAHPDYPLRRYMTSDSAAGVIVRRLLPTAIGFTLVTGWLILQGDLAGYFSTAFALALFTAVSIVGLGALILWNAGIIFEADAKRKLAGELLRKTQSLLNETQHISKVGGWEYDVAAHRVAWTDEVYRMHGVSKDYDPGNPKQDMQFYIPDDEARLAEAFQQAVEKGSPYDLELQLVNAQGVRLWVRTIGQAERKNNEIVRVFGNIIDITERKRAEQELSKYHDHLEDMVRERTSELDATNKDLEEFVYSIAHDLGVPLRAVNGFSRILLTEYQHQLDDEGKRYLNVVRDNTKRMGQLIEDILAFSRLRRAKMRVSEINMEALAREVWRELQPSMAGREVRLEIKPMPSVQGDPAMLRQVWANLLGNAAKFTNTRTTAIIEIGGSLGLAANGEGNECTFYVKDNGVGFDQQYVHKLFGVFQRLHGIDEFEGTGIGLAIVKRIVTRHGGRVWAESKVNEGAVFYFALPVFTEVRS